MTPLQQTKQAAIEAKKNLYLPKFIKTAKTAGLELCWQGRIIRAQELANDALQKQEKDKLEKLVAAIIQLQHEYDEAGRAYDLALKAYEQLGGDPAEIEVGACTCPYCQKVQAQDTLYLSEDRLRAAVFAITEPDPDYNDPLPLALMSKNTDEAKNQAWQLFIDLCNAQANYKRACLLAGRVPTYQYILRAW